MPLTFKFTAKFHEDWKHLTALCEHMRHKLNLAYPQVYWTQRKGGQHMWHSYRKALKEMTMLGTGEAMERFPENVAKYHVGGRYG